MTEEEYFRKNYPDTCYGEKPLSPYWDFFQDGVEFGERQSGKKIEELEKENEQLTVAYETLKLHDQEEIGMLKAQIYEMKCCQNCKFKDCDKSSRYQTCWYCKNKDKWQFLKEIEK